MFEQFFANLRLPNHHIHHQSARKIALLLLATLVSICTGIGMAYFSYALVDILFTAITTLISTSVLATLSLTEDRRALTAMVNNFFDAYAHPLENNMGRAIRAGIYIGGLAAIAACFAFISTSSVSLLFCAVTALNVFTSMSFCMVMGLSAQARRLFNRWVVEMIHPPQPVVLPLPDNNPQRTRLLNELEENLVNVNLAQSKDDLKNIFRLRTYVRNIPDAEANFAIGTYNASVSVLGYFFINSPEGWNNPRILNGIETGIKDSIGFSNRLLAKIEQDCIRRYGSVTTQGMSGMLTNPAYPYGRDLLTTGVVDLYHRLRSRTYYQGNMQARHNNPGQQHDAEAWDAAFYQEGTPQNAARKLYNTFVKHGFYLRYGNRVFKDELRTQNALCLDWMQVDSRRTRQFTPMPGQR